MFRKISANLSRYAISNRQGGQVSILFALLMPIFILFLGVALDLGWYYLNVSRLQNAADAAAVAGAQALVDSDNFSDYKNVALVGHYPGKVSNQYRVSDIYELTTLENGKHVAEEYIGKNLSGNENILVNSWTRNKVETETPTLYTKNDNLYFVVRLKDTIQHFFLPGWFDDMDAPVTAVAMLSKTAITNTPGESDNPEMPAASTIPTTSSNSDLPTMPSMPTNPLVISQEFQYALEDDRNKNVIIGNWEVQNKYKDNTTQVTLESGEKITKYEAIFGTKVYSQAWNHFQDFYTHYVSGSFYRTQTVTILDDVLFNTDNNGNDTVYEYGKTSSVAATSASINNDKNSSAYNPGVTARKTYKAGITDTDTVGLPYTWKRVDSLNIDFRPEVSLSGKWLSQDWDLDWSAGGVGYSNSYKSSCWDTTGELKAEVIRTLRIHTSINFDGVYKARSGQDSPDILWMRIESEPMLNHPDIINDEVKAKYSSILNINGLNSVNQIIINANASNANTDYRPYIVFYDGPESNDVYDSHKNDSNVLHRKSLPVILNLNVPFRAIFYMPESPVVITGDAKDFFQGFVVAKSYMRLKNDGDFIRSNEKGRFSLPIYYAKDDTANPKTPYYKVTDENGIEMYVDERGDIQFADFTNYPTNYGSYNVFGRTNLSTHGFEIPQYSSINMFLKRE